MHWTYAAIMTAAMVTAALVLRRTRQPLGLTSWEALAVGLGAFCGGMIGAKLPFVLSDVAGLLSGAAWFDDGKTIMAGLVGGYVGAHLTEWALGVRMVNCDGFAAPVAAAVAVGRLACYSAGCCHGVETSLPWGVDFDDGVYRHPTQLYEFAFHFAAAVVLFRLQQREILRGQLVRAYFVSYFVFRFATEFLRPEPALWLGLTGYQWAALALIPAFGLRRSPMCCPAVGPPERTARVLPAEVPGRQWLKATRALCPKCLRAVPGTTYVEDGKVYLQRECLAHGTSRALVSEDRRHYYLRDEVPHGRPDGPAESPGCACCGPRHKTCVALLELTEACNLACPVCFAASAKGSHRDFASLAARLEGFLAARGSLDILQLSGGEPLLHPDLLRIVDHAKRLGVAHVMINTNGLRLLDEPELAVELARRRPGVELCLQMDGLDRRSHEALRGADLLTRKLAVLEKLVEHDLPTTLVATVARGVNEEQLGELVRFGLARRAVRGLTVQPATWSGRFDRPADPMDRVTLAEVVRRLVEQSRGLVKADDFKPLPCSNPNCCSFTFIARPRWGRTRPATRLVRYEDYLDRLADRMNFNLGDARACCGKGWHADDFFRIVIKPFMDAHTYDRERIEECCVHVIGAEGKAVSFCEFNILQRCAGARSAAQRSAIMPSARGESSLPWRLVWMSAAIAACLSAAPLILYGAMFGPIPTVLAREAKRQLAEDPSAVLVDVRWAESFAAGHIAGAISWPLDRVLAIQEAANLPAALAGKRLLLVSDVGMASREAAWHLKQIGIEGVFQVRGGIQEWPRASWPRDPNWDRWVDAAGAVGEFSFRASPRAEQAAAVIAYFFFKPIYMLLALGAAAAVWQRREADLAALGWGMLAFFLGELACAVNYFAFQETSYFWEYLHGLGMMLALGLVIYAVLEGVDRRVLGLSDAERRCAAAGLCGHCVKHGDGPCRMWQVFLLVIPAFLVLTMMLPSADWQDGAYETLVFGQPYHYAHLRVFQQLENWYCPAAAAVLLSASLATLAVGGMRGIAAAKITFSAGLGALGFGAFRLFLGSAYDGNRVWFLFWEETTELVLVVGVCFVLWVFRHTLAPRLVAWEERAKRLLTSALT